MDVRWDNEEIARVRDLLKGNTRAAVARLYGVSSERIRQIIAKDDRRITKDVREDVRNPAPHNAK